MYKARHPIAPQRIHEPSASKMPRNSKSDDSSSLYFAGNLSNTIMILNTLSFLGFMLFPSSLSTSYTSDGFCVSSPGSLFSSHYLCFYVDTITSILLYLFAKKYEKIHGIEKIIQTLPGILAHGLGHLALGYHYPPSSLIISDRSLLFRLLSSLGMSLFFYFMFLSVPNLSNQKLKIVPISIIYGVININFLPPTFSFTFVQSALLLTVGYFDMVNPGEKASRRSLSPH
ncbi:hypothetical protein TL16_g08699 [Triparma laevis f. inornata]|uniref:Uncharacterized protein n=1 Tax=Triparma laevis f. inornata TaxID=1714386 RepID=A0A9W7B470_9STRA|nr:hypothetical protein TL16_g08699 [Triparma laevis f. inornata]